MDAYNNSLTKSTPVDLSTAGSRNLTGASNNNYALFGGGYTNGVDAYNNQLSQHIAPSLNDTMYGAKAVRAGNYVLFCGGNRQSSSGSYSASNKIDSYDNNLVHSVLLTTLQYSADNTYMSVTDFNSYAIIKNQTIIEIFDNNLTKTTKNSSATYNTEFSGMASIENYALFAGGMYYGSDRWVSDDEVIALNANFTISKMKLFSNRHLLLATSIGDYALFGGGIFRSAKSGVSDQNLTSVEAFYES